MTGHLYYNFCFVTPQINIQFTGITKLTKFSGCKAKTHTFQLNALKQRNYTCNYTANTRIVSISSTEPLWLHKKTPTLNIPLVIATVVFICLRKQQLKVFGLYNPPILRPYAVETKTNFHCKQIYSSSVLSWKFLLLGLTRCFIKISRRAH